MYCNGCNGQVCGENKNLQLDIIHTNLCPHLSSLRPYFKSPAYRIIFELTHENSRQLLLFMLPFVASSMR